MPFAARRLHPEGFGATAIASASSPETPSIGEN